MQTDTGSTAAFAALIPLFLLILAFAIVEIVALWKVFTKAGEPGWAALIPFYNTYVMTKIAGYNPVLFLLFLVPLVTIVFAVLVMLGIGRGFGKSTGWSIVMLVIFNAIGMLILGFGQAQYRYPAAAQFSS